VSDLNLVCTCTPP